MRTRRNLGTGLALTGILLAVLAVHTMDATDAPLPRPAPAPEAASETQPSDPSPDISSAAVAHVTLPPPPPLPKPQAVTPVPVAAAPPREVTPLKPAPQPEQAAPRAATVKPLTPQAETIAKKLEPRRIEPLAPAPKPDPAPVKAKTPQPKPRTPIEVESTLARHASPTSAAGGDLSKATDAVPDETLRRAGRPLLRLLEHGEGPALEIAWPGDRRERTYLHRLFAQCYGMRVALIDDAGRLFDTRSAPGMPWVINTDRFSGFIRQSSGGIAVEERQTVMRIRARHGLGADAATVRIFPRRADALLLGGLNRLVPDYRKAKRIQARYHLADNRVRIDAIRVDGEPVAGAIDLTRASRRGCIL